MRMSLPGLASWRRRGSTSIQTAKKWALLGTLFIVANLYLASHSLMHRSPDGNPNQNIRTVQAQGVVRQGSVPKKRFSKSFQEALSKEHIVRDDDRMQFEILHHDHEPDRIEGEIQVKRHGDDSEVDPMDPEVLRLGKLKQNESLPLVFFEVEIKGAPVGIIEMVLYPDVAPRAAENFRQLCTGEAGTVPNEPGREGAGQKLHLKGASFYRIIHEFIDQSGINTESVFGGRFKDDPGGLQLKHEHKGILSMANMGPDTNTAHFSIMMGHSPHLDGKYTIFGQVVSGFAAVDAINALSIDKPDKTATAEDGAVISNCGQLRKGTIIPNLS